MSKARISFSGLFLSLAWVLPSLDFSAQSVKAHCTSHSAPVPKELKAADEQEFEIADGVKMKFCWVPAGKATLGSPNEEKDRYDDEKEHEYVTKGFWLGKYPVTQAEWKAVMGKTQVPLMGKRTTGPREWKRADSR